MTEPRGARKYGLIPVLLATMHGIGDPVAQDPAADASLSAIVDSIVDREALSRSVPAVAIAIVADGHVVLRRAWGVADVEARRTATAATPFNIASLTKPFTAALVLRLVEEGKVALDDPVRRHLTWLPERYATITVRQLLTHTSGIARDMRLDNFDDPDAVTYRARLDSAPASAPAGQRFEYSNAGYTVLGWLVERVEGEPLEEVLARRVFRPLGMTHARYRATLEADPLRARPYAVSDTAVRRIAHLTGGFGSGGVSMSATDAAAFALGLQAGDFLPRRWADTAWTPAVLADGSEVSLRMFAQPASYGYGWFLASYAGRRMLTHGGGIEGYTANLYHFPTERLTIVVLANAKGRDDGVAPVDPIARRIADACLARNACRPD